jgi:hypothetical protein
LLSDGSHLVQVAAVDPAGNEVRSTAQTITVDNGAPDAPRALAVEGGGDWRADNSYAVSWMNPGGQPAPIAAAHYEICGIQVLACGPEEQIVAPNVSRIDGLSVPSTGEWAVHVWLEDAAGNVDPLRVATTTLRYGSPPRIPPAQPAPVLGDSSAAVLEPDALTAIPAPPSTAPRLLQPLPRCDPLLRLTSARLGHHGHLVIRGGTAPGASARVSLTVRLKDRGVLRRSFVTSGGRFAVQLALQRVRTFRGIVTARFAGNTAFRPTRVTLRATG